MACRGVFFSVDEQQRKALLDAQGDDELMAVVEEIEEAWDEEHLAECDKSWDALHRLLTDGQLAYGNGEYPLSHCVLGPRQLHEGDDYIVSLVDPPDVAAVAARLKSVTQEWFADRYRNVVPSDYDETYGEEDLEYTWEWFQDVRKLYESAAAEGRSVIFTVDQ
jgi:hypothetical protein